MKVIYEPRGRAREYAALACNLYRGCSHRCAYCYAPAIQRQTMATWGCDAPEARPGILDALNKDAFEMKQKHIQDEVLFCFMSDPYHGGDTAITRRALSIMGEQGLRATVLTKGGMRAARDFNLMERYGFKFGSTIVFRDDSFRAKWEPGAASIDDRLEAVRTAHERGIYTWISLEPVIDAAQALRVIEDAHLFVDFWKVGKINHNAIERETDWSLFLKDVTALLDSVGAEHYIKKDLRAFA